MEPCFKREELWALVEEARGINPDLRLPIPTEEQIKKHEAVFCPFCRQKTFKFIGHLDMAEATFRCGNCLFLAEIDTLTKKDRAEVIKDFFQTLIRTYEKARETIDRIMNIINQYRA